MEVIAHKTVGFNGAELMAAKTKEDKLFVGVRWICEGIGLSVDQSKRQLKNVREDLVVSKGVSNLTLPTNGGYQEVLCIELDYLPLWLAKISITPKMQAEAPWLVERLVEYQLKAKDVLAAAFVKQAKPKTQAELIAMMAQHNVEQERRLSAVEERLDKTSKKQEHITEILSLNPTEWRKKVRNLLNKIALKQGGFEAFREIRNQSYERLEERAKCDLSIRLNNRKKNMALEGLPKSKINAANNLDVIASDARLTEIYLAIVKEMAIEYDVDPGNVDIRKEA